jgi:hypothetical protein
MQAQEDQNYIDAWKNGGEVDGKPVNDARLLAHFKARRDSLSKDDPLWDEWDNRLTQYTFAIEESKMSLKWDQKKVSESQMSAFYARWAHKATKNSEFRRTLESSAARWRAAANQRSGGSGGSGSSAAEAHANWVKNYWERHVKGGEVLKDGLVAIAMQYQAIPASTSSYSPPTLADINPDSAGYGDFLDIYEDGKVDDPLVQNLIEDVTREIRKTNPDFVFDKRHIDNLLDRSQEGLGTLVRKSTTQTERNDWQDRRGEIRQSKNHIKQAPIMQRVFDAQDQYIETTYNCHGNYACERAAAVAFRDTLSAEGARLMRGGQEQADLSVTPFISGTIEYIDSALNGKLLDPTTPEGRKPTIFDLNGVTGGAGDGYLQGTTKMWFDNEQKMANGGWVSSTPVPGPDGQPLLDDDGDPTYFTVVHDASEPVPVDAIEVPASGVMDGAPAGARAWLLTGSVDVTYVAPDGTLLAAGDVSTKVTKEDGTVGYVPPQGMPKVVATTIPGLVYDGKAVNVYRTGLGTPESPFLYHTTLPTVEDAAGRKLTTRAAANNSGARVFVAPAAWDETLNEGKGGWVADNSMFDTAINDARTLLPSEAYVPGTFRTLSAAQKQAAIDKLYRENDPDADSEAKRLIASMADEQRAATAEGDVFKASQLGADAGQMQRQVELYQTSGMGATFDDQYRSMNQWTPAQQEWVDKLAARGITAETVGEDALKERMKAVAQLPEADKADLTKAGQRMNQWVQYGVVPPATETDSRAAREARILDPNLALSELRIPGYTPPAGSDKPQRPWEWFSGPSVLPSSVSGTTPINPLDTNGPSPYANPRADALGEMYSRGVDLPTPKPPKPPTPPPPKPEPKPKQSKNPRANPSWSSGTRTIADSTRGTWYDPTTGTVHTAASTSFTPMTPLRPASTWGSASTGQPGGRALGGSW